jgi:hypothetical protein
MGYEFTVSLLIGHSHTGKTWLLAITDVEPVPAEADFRPNDIMCISGVTSFSGKVTRRVRRNRPSCLAPR